MGRPLPLAVQLGRISHDSREAIAAKVLSLANIRDLASKAALQGMTEVSIPLGPVNLDRTAAADALRAELKGFTFEWVESRSREGELLWYLQLHWPLSADSS